MVSHGKRKAGEAIPEIGHPLSIHVPSAPHKSCMLQLLTARLRENRYAKPACLQHICISVLRAVRKLTISVGEMSLWRHKTHKQRQFLRTSVCYPTQCSKTHSPGQCAIHRQLLKRFKHRLIKCKQRLVPVAINVRK